MLILYRIPQEGHVLKSTSSSSEILESELENGLILKQVYDQWISKKDSRDLSILQKPLINDVWTSYTLLPNWSKTANFAYQVRYISYFYAADVVQFQSS